MWILDVLPGTWPMLVFVVVLYASYCYVRNRGLPPGPYGLPYFGYSFFFDRSRASEQLNELCQRYKTDILCIGSINTNLVILNTHQLMKEVFQKRTDAADRSKFSLFRTFDPSFSGIIATSGDEWKEARRLSLSMLRNFGMGRIGAEERIQTEAEILVECFREHKNKPFDPQQYINVAVSNIISGMVFGQRFQHTDREFLDALRGMNDLVQRLTSVKMTFIFRSQFAKKYIFNELYQHCEDDYKRFSDFVDERIREHEEAYSGEVTDLIYGYMKEMKEGESVYLDKTMLRSLIVDFFFAGSETTYTTLRWCFLAMAAFPEIQKKVQEELDDVIGERIPSMNDKTSTPYSEATMCEVQRHYTLIQLGVGHTNRHHDIQIQGYTVPKDSFILANINAIHHDPDYWKNPAEFDPQNFLENGKVSNTERLVSFGIGRRACAGEALARMELYVFFTHVMKEFQVRLETDESVPDLKGNVAGVYQPKPFKIRMIPRR